MARLLIIDDDPAVTRTLARMLEHQGHAVDCAESGTSGFQHACQTPPDAIILDFRMPGMGGLEFLRAIRANATLSAVPIAVLTGDYFLPETVLAELRALGATLRFKPVWLADLTALVAELLPQAGPASGKDTHP